MFIINQSVVYSPVIRFALKESKEREVHFFGKREFQTTGTEFQISSLAPIGLKSFPNGTVHENQS